MQGHSVKESFSLESPKQNEKNMEKSDLLKSLKLRFFRAAVESILPYGCATWSLSRAEEKALDGCYTRMLRKVYNIDGLAKISNAQLYNGLNPVSETIRFRRLKLAGHTFRDKSSPAHYTVTWDPQHGNMRRGRPSTTFVDTLLRDTDLTSTTELEACIADRDVWRCLQSRCQSQG